VIDTWGKEESHNQFVIRTIIIISSHHFVKKNLYIVYTDKRRNLQELRNYNELIDIIHRYVAIIRHIIPFHSQTIKIKKPRSDQFSY